jgi:hypothetical protein
MVIDPTKSRSLHFSGVKLILLNNACIPITEAFGHPPYIVGSSTERDDYRDVDVRSIIPDEDFDAIFNHREFLWSLVCLAVSDYLSRASGLPIDYQIQRMTEANEKYVSGARNPVGMRARPYAGGGDATRFGQGASDGD